MRVACFRHVGTLNNNHIPLNNNIYEKGCICGPTCAGYLLKRISKSRMGIKAGLDTTIPW